MQENRVWIFVLAALWCASWLAGCRREPRVRGGAAQASTGPDNPRPDNPRPDEGRRGASVATAVLEPRSGSATRGSAVFTKEGETTHLVITVRNAPPGKRAVHIHEKGDCSAPDAESAGGHWNPTGAAHGRWGDPPFHLGDIGNIEVGQDGTGTFKMRTDRWEIGTGGAKDIAGKSVVVHAGADDFVTQPTGGAGDRIACGVIRRGR